MTEQLPDDPELAYVEELFGPVIGNFTINTLPSGAAPEAIKKQWIDITLPVRRDLLELEQANPNYVDAISGLERYNPQPMPVHGIDAVRALREAGRFEAADYWESNGLGTITLNFREDEGLFDRVIPEAVEH